MSLLKEAILSLTEDAVGGSTGAGSIANVRGSLFAGGYVNGKVVERRQKKKPKTIFRRVGEQANTTTTSSAGGDNDFEDEEFDEEDVLSKMRAAEQKSKGGDDPACFGLEDDSGNIIKIYVRKEQGDAFEEELGNMMYVSREEERPLDIAEVIFELSKKFDVVDADWGESIVADEEQEETQAGQVATGGAQGQPAGGAPGAAGPGGSAGAEPGAEGAAAGAEPGAEGEGGEGEEGEMTAGDLGAEGGAEGDLMGAGDEEGAKSALQQVIDMMKADAEAKKAEAEAKKAEARAKEAEYTAKSAEHKMKQEEQVLDAEDYYDQKNKENKEAKDLAKLAKYRHDRARDAEGILSHEGVDTRGMDRRTLHSISELSDLILENLKSQKPKKRR